MYHLLGTKLLEMFGRKLDIFLPQGPRLALLPTHGPTHNVKYQLLPNTGVSSSLPL